MTDRKIVQVRDVMKKKFDMIDGMATVSDALSTMKHVETKCLVVNKRHVNDEYGMLLISDIARQVVARDRSPQRVNVYEIMAKPVITVDPDMDIRYCARLFERFHLSRAPVLENNEVVGIISFTDMVLKGLIE
jgi:CBS domain-containing protein